MMTHFRSHVCLISRLRRHGTELHSLESRAFVWTNHLVADNTILNAECPYAPLNGHGDNNPQGPKPVPAPRLTKLSQRWTALHAPEAMHHSNHHRVQLCPINLVESWQATLTTSDRHKTLHMLLYSYIAIVVDINIF